jgi:acetyl esterase/lipase
VVGIATALGFGATVSASSAGASGSVPAASSAGHAVTLTTVSYGSDPLQTETVFAGTHPNGRSVVMVHGGGFRSSVRDAIKLATNARSLVAEGDTVFSVNYRSDVGGVGIADQVADVVAGIRLAIADAPTFGADPSRLAVIGGSSGGLLAADASEELNTLVPGTVRSVVTLSAPTDFATALTYWEGVGGSLGKVHINDLTGTLGCTVVTVNHVTTYDCPAPLEALYSPDQQVTSSNCPAQWLIVNGTAEIQPMSQATALDEALVAQGCPQTLDIFADTAHSYDYWTAVLPTIEAALAAA